MGLMGDDRGNAVMAAVFVIVGVAVGISLTIDLVNNRVAANDTLNFTSAVTFVAVSGNIDAFTSLANTTTTLTSGTDYRATPANNTVQLLQTGTTNLANCVAAGGNASCNYFAVYRTVNATTATVLNILPVIFAAAIMVGIITMVQGRRQ